MPIYKCTAFNTCMSWFLFIYYLLIIFLRLYFVRCSWSILICILMLHELDIKWHNMLKQFMFNDLIGTLMVSLSLLSE